MWEQIQEGPDSTRGGADAQKVQVAGRDEQWRGRRGRAPAEDGNRRNQDTRHKAGTKLKRSGRAGIKVLHADTWETRSMREPNIQERGPAVCAQ